MKLTYLKKNCVFNAIFWLFVVVNLLIPCVVSSQEANNSNIKASSQADIVKSDRLAARSSAIKNAMKRAVEQAVEMFVSSDTIALNFQLLTDEIYSNAKGYIKSFNVLSEEVIDDIYTVTIDADVSFNDVKKALTDIKILAEKKDLPKFLMFIAEKNIGDDEYKFWWKIDEEDSEEETGLTLTAENELKKRFLEKGFYSADKTKALRKLKKSGFYAEAEITDYQAIEAVKHTSAEIIITGKALALVLGGISGTQMKSILANVTAKAMDSQGETIVSESASAKVLHIDEALAGEEALKRASAKLADKLMGKIIEKFAYEEHKSTLIDLNVTGLTYSRFKRFIDILQNDIRGVASIRRKSFTSGGIANLEVITRGDAAYLSKELTRRGFDDFNIDVEIVSENNIKVTLKEKVLD